MAVSEREVKNKRNSTGGLTGKPGIVYDVNIKYKSGGSLKSYTKKVIIFYKNGMIAKFNIIKLEATVFVSSASLNC